MVNNDKPNATLEDVLMELKSLNVKKKDFWDRLLPASAFIFSVVLGGASIWFTQSYNNRQIQISQMQATHDIESKRHQEKIQLVQTVQGYLPYLTSENEAHKETAILLITSLQGPEFATTFARLKTSKKASAGEQAAADIIMANAPPSGRERNTYTGLSEPSLTADKGSGTSMQKQKGWVYLGHFSFPEHKWSTQYFQFSSTAEPFSLVSASLMIRQEKGTVNVRRGMPTEGGAFEGIRDVLKPGVEVKVRAVQEWSSSGFMWAEIEYET